MWITSLEARGSPPLKRVDHLPESAWIERFPWIAWIALGASGSPFSDRVDHLPESAWMASLGARGSPPLECVDRLPWSAWLDSLGELPRNAWIASLSSRGCVRTALAPANVIIITVAVKSIIDDNRLSWSHYYFRFKRLSSYLFVVAIASR